MTETQHSDELDQIDEPTSSVSTTTESDIPVTVVRVSKKRRQTKRRQRNWAWGFAGLTLLFGGFAAVMGYEVYDNALDLRGGDASLAQTDATAAGYEASVLPTPLHLAAVVGADGLLVDVMLFVEGSNDESGVSGAGAIVWIVGQTEVSPDFGPAEEAPQPVSPDVPLGQESPTGRLADIYQQDGMDGLVVAVENLVGFGINDNVVLGPEQIAALVEPVGELAINNPDPLSVDFGGEIVTPYEQGELALAPDEVLGYLSVNVPGEVATNRATRASIVMQALIAEYGGVEVSGLGTVTTSSGDDMIDTLVSMSAEPVDFVVLPVTLHPERLAYEAEPDVVAETLQDVVQFPVSAFPGQRERVRLLNGTTNLSAATAAAPIAVSAGGDVAQIGNAAEFSDGPTTVEFHVLSAAETAMEIAEQLGVEAIPTTNNSDVFDITVTLGSDYLP